MNYIDIIIISLLLFAALYGIWKGFVRQLFGLIALFLGIWCACHFSYFIASYLSQWFNKNETAIAIISFAITFIIVLIGVIQVGRVTEKLVKLAALGLFNRIFGLLFSVIKMAFILSISIWLMLAFDQFNPFFPHHDCEHSILFIPVSTIAPAVFPYLKIWIAAIK